MNRKASTGFSNSAFVNLEDRKELMLNTRDTDAKQSPDRMERQHRFSVISEVISSKRESSYSLPLVCAVVATLLTCSIPAGYNMGVVNTPEVVLKGFCNRTLSKKGVEMTETGVDLIWSVVVSVFLVGAVFGSAMATWMADRLGRKLAVMVTSSLGLMSAAMFAVSDVSDMVAILILGRFLAGIHCGIGSGLVPTYLMEIAPQSLRGVMGVLPPFGLCCGLLVAQLLGQQSMLGTEDGWPLLLSLTTPLIGLGLVTLVFSPESPVYLYVNQGKEEKALKVMRSLRNRSIDKMDAEIVAMKGDKLRGESVEWSIMSLLRAKELRLSVFLICFLHFGQQMSGINAVFYYSTSTFKKAGMSTQESQYASIGLASLNLLVSFSAIVLVKKFNKKALLVVSCVGAFLSLIVLTSSLAFQEYVYWMPFVTVGAFMTFVVFYGFGLGPVPFMIGSSLFEQGPRGVGMSLGCLCNWLSNFIIAVSFPVMQRLLNEYIFIIFSAFCVLTGVVSLLMIPPENDGEQKPQPCPKSSEVRRGSKIPDTRRKSGAKVLQP